MLSPHLQDTAVSDSGNIHERPGIFNKQTVLDKEKINMCLVNM